MLDNAMKRKHEKPTAPEAPKMKTPKGHGLSKRCIGVNDIIWLLKVDLVNKSDGRYANALT